MPPYGGIPFRDLPTGLGHDLGHPEQLLARASAMYGLAHSHPSLYCPRVAIKTLEGRAFEPLDRNRLGAFYRVCRASEREFGLLGLGLVAGGAPEPLLGARG